METRARTARGCPCKFTDRVHLSAFVIRPHAGIRGSTWRHEGAQLTPSSKRVSPSRKAHSRVRSAVDACLENPPRREIIFLSRASQAATHLEWSHDWSAVFGALFACVCSIYKTLTGKRGWRADLGDLPACPRTHHFFFLRACTMLRSLVNPNSMPTRFGPDRSNKLDFK